MRKIYLMTPFRHLHHLLFEPTEICHSKESRLDENSQKSQMKTKRHSPRMGHEWWALEPRILFDGAALATGGEVVSDNAPQDATASHGMDGDNSVDSALTESFSEEAPWAFDLSLGAPTERKEIVFIDTGVEDFHTLMVGIDPQAEVILLDSTRDGLEQIAEILGERSDIDAIHIISHGSQGELQLGTGRLTVASMQGEYADELMVINEALSQDADFLIYGCNFGEGAVGQEAASLLAELTGADIAASQDMTGSAELGGDWDLEVQTGTIESAVVVDAEAQAGFGGLLDITTNLQGHWTFDADATDSSGNNYDGTLTNGASIDTTDSTDIIGEGKLSTDGLDDYVDLSTHVGNFSGLTQGTIAAWVKTTDGGSQYVFSLYDRSESSGAGMGIDNGELFWVVQEGGTVVVNVEANISLNDNTWHHIAVTVDGSGNKLFIDGVQVTSGNLTYLDGNASTTAFFDDVSFIDDMQIGALDDTGGIQFPYDGLIDDVRVYDRALTAADIDELFASSNPLVVDTTSDTADGDTSSISALMADKGADGNISLREAITAANNTTGTDTISFNIAGAGPHTIALGSVLPTITDTVIIDGTTEPDYGGSPIIELDGSGITGGAASAKKGLQLVAGSDGSTIKGLVINQFAGHGIEINSSNNTVHGTYIGTNVAGTSIAGFGNGEHGVTINSSGNTIGGSGAGEANIISGNQVGVSILGTGSNSNTITGNFIGTDITGVLDLGNLFEGVVIGSDADNNIIGGASVGSGNTIAFNDSAGVLLVPSSVTGVAILGNQIYSNAGLGIDLDSNGVTANDVNDPDTGSNNLQNFPVLTGAVTDGMGTITVDGTLDTDGLTQDYRIEFFASVTADASGQGEAERYLGFATVTTDGSGEATFSEAISATVVAGEFITATATVDLGGGNYGDTSEFAQNVVATSSVAGVLIVDTTSDVADGDTSSISALLTDKGADGFISLREAMLATNNTANLDGSTPDEIHFNISGVGPHTISVLSGLPDITDAVIIDGTTEPDFVSSPVMTIDGTLVSGVPAGFSLMSGSDGSTIRGFAITQFPSNGILIDHSNGNLIEGNYIGLEVDGTTLALNAGAGIEIIASSDTMIGGSTTAQRNVISGNSQGILLWSGTTGTIIQGNYIGTDVSGTVDLGNSGTGVLVTSGATNNIIGGTVAGAGNLISGNDNYGVRISGSGTTGNVLQGNFIGTDATGTVDLGNTWHGVLISGGAANNTIGGTAVEAGNVISGNDQNGINLVDTGTSGNVVQGNKIGTDVTGTADLGNAWDGILLSTGATNNMIGGTAAGAGNVISGNDQRGVSLKGTGTANNAVEGNVIGTDMTGTLDLGNGLSGVELSIGANTNTIGGTTAGAGNVMAYNQAYGIHLVSTAGTDNTLLGNQLYANTDLGINLSGGTEDGFGVTANDAGDADTGANLLQNYPVLSTVTTTGSEMTVTGSLNGTANTTFRIEFFASSAADGSNYGEAERYLGYATVTTDGTGNATINTTLTVSVAVGEFLTATATVDLGGGNYGDTSEFAQNVTATSNSAPVNMVPGAQLVDEDTLLSISGISVNDTDGNLSTVQLSVTNGTLNVTLSGAATISAGANGSSTLTLSGSQADINATLASLTYQGNLNYNGADTLTVLSTDSNSSTDSDTVAITVNAVNNAPVLDNSGLMSLTTITEDDINNSGDLVSAIIASAGGDRITDVDPGALEGIAIASLASSNGTWEYNTGSGWTAVGSVSTSNSLLLRATDSLRFVPDGQNADTGFITFFAWDQTSGTAGTKVSTFTNGGATAFSSEFGTASISVTAVNDAPTVTNLDGDILAYTEGDGVVVIEQGADAVVSDVDSSDFDTGTLTVSFAAGSDAGEDVLAIRHQGTGAGQIGVSGSDVTYQGVTIGTFTGGSGGTNLVITLNASAGATAVTALVQNITYENTDTTTPTPGARTVRYVLTDGDGGTSVDYDTTVMVSAQNDAPVANPDSFTLVEDGSLTTSLPASFGPEQVISNASEGHSIAAADVDGDGDLDVVAASLNLDTVSWFENTDGLGTFGPEQVITNLADGAFSVAAADVDGDGDLDVVVAAYFSDTVSWFENADGLGTFGAEQVITNLADGARTVTAADVDGDGDLDVVVGSDRDDTVAWFENTDGLGTFGAEQVVSNLLDSPTSVQAADMDGDGDLDVVVGSYADDTVAWFENTNGLGTFGPPQIITSVANGVTSVAVADVDGDSDMDVIVTSYIDDTVAWFENTDGLGTFGAEQVITNLADGARAVTVADVDGDGDLDVAVASALDDTVAWYDNADGLGTFGSEQVITNLADGAYAVTVGDVDGDGDLDIVAGSANDDTVSWFENVGSSVLNNDTDVDGDPLTAILVTDVSNGTLVLNADGTFTYTPDPNFSGVDSFTYKANDGTADSNTVTVTLNVTPVNDAPVITSDGGGATAGVNAQENQTSVTTVVATDADVPVDTLTYTIMGGVDAGLFTLNPSSGVLTFNAAPDFETPTDANGDGIYEVTVQVADGNGGFDTQAISVTVTNTNELPVITSDGGGATATVNAQENQTSVTTVVATDADVPVDPLTYTIIGGADAGLFTLNPGSGVLTFTAAPDYETPTDANGDGIYEVTVQVADGNGGFDTQAISVTVMNTNELPVITSDGGGATATVNAQENQTSVTTVVATDADVPVDPLTYTIIGGADAGLFTLNPGSGVLTFNAAPDFETPTDANGDGIYEVTVQVADGNGGFATQAISVTVTDQLEGSPPAPPPSPDPTPDPSPDPPPPDPTPDPAPEPEPDPPSPPPPGPGPTSTVGGTWGLEGSLGRQLEDPQKSQRDFSLGNVLNLPPMFSQKNWLSTSDQIRSLAPLGVDILSPRLSPEFFRQLGVFSENVQESIDPENTGWEFNVSSIKGTGIALSAGMVAWLLRGGTLLSTFLASMPAWKNFDPIPILDMNKKDQERWNQHLQESSTLEAREHQGLSQILHSSPSDSASEESPRSKRESRFTHLR